LVRTSTWYDVPAVPWPIPIVSASWLDAQGSAAVDWVTVTVAVGPGVAECEWRVGVGLGDGDAIGLLVGGLPLATGEPPEELELQPASNAPTPTPTTTSRARTAPTLRPTG